MPNIIADRIAASELRVSPVRREEMPVVQSIIRSSAKWYERFVEKQDMHQHLVNDAWAEQNFARREFFLGYRGNKPFGTLSFQTLRNGVGYLGYVYLDVKMVGNGLGKRLLNFALERARRKNLSHLALIAHPRAEWAVKAYEKFGFRRIASSKAEVLAWNGGAMKPYYEEGFELYLKEVA